MHCQEYKLKLKQNYENESTTVLMPRWNALKLYDMKLTLAYSSLLALALLVALNLH